MLECACEEKVVRKRPCRNGSFQYVRQCLNCGQCSNAVRSLDLKVQEMNDAGPVDESLRERWYEAWRAARLRAIQDQREEDLAEWREDAEEYYRSEPWQRRRRLVMRRCEGLCEGCGVHPATQVHHLTYEHWRSEFLFELVGICERCHAMIHPHMRDKEREAA
jgi:hypothetical protein